MSGSDPAYDESAIRDHLDGLAVVARVTFAAACAEWLYASYEEYARVSGQGDTVALRDVIDDVWMLADLRATSPGDLERLRTLAESLVPGDDDDGWSTLSPVAQNAAASAAYAVRSRLIDDPREAVWAARQLFEAGDYLVQLSVDAHSSAATGDPQAPVSLVISGIATALEHAGNRPVAVVRDEAARGGLRLRQLLVDSV